jgi:hypothetical protein
MVSSGASSVEGFLQLEANNMGVYMPDLFDGG